MQKFFTQKALILFTLAFILLAAVSFAAFRETGQVCEEAHRSLQHLSPTHKGEMIWEVMSRGFLSLLAI